MFPLGVNAQGRHGGGFHGHSGNFHGGFHRGFNHGFNNHFRFHNNRFGFHNRGWWINSGFPIYFSNGCYFYYYDGCYYPADGYNACDCDNY